MANNIFQLFGEMKENPYLGEYIKEGLLNKIPFVNRDEQEQNAYIGARAEGMADFMGRPNLPEVATEIYNSGGYEPEWFLDELFSGANYRLYPDGGYPTVVSNDSPAVAGVSDVGYGVQPTASNGYGDTTTPIAGSRLYTNKDDVYYWTPAPFAEGVPQQALDFYDKYSYNGRGQFANPLNPDYIQALWNEIVQQTPGESPENQAALLETMLGMSHAESHGGYDAGGINDRKTNVFNVGYNARPTSVMKYDPEDINEMSDYAVNQMINTFNILKNRGLTDKVIHNYHIGPNAAYNQAGVDNYKSYIGGWESLYKPNYSWVD